jgi:hypothetical protein
LLGKTIPAIFLSACHIRRHPAFYLYFLDGVVRYGYRAQSFNNQAFTEDIIMAHSTEAESSSLHQKENGLKPPLDLSHHFSRVTKARKESSIKEFYKYFTIPGIGNLAGGKYKDLIHQNNLYYRTFYIIEEKALFVNSSVFLYFTLLVLQISQ